ncbi:MAG: 5'-nucleotidase C-terminal domain-containing protein [Pseudomonadota bacterium]
MHRRLTASLLLFAGIFLPLASLHAEPDSQARSPVTVLLINDVYRLDNLAGMRTLRRTLEAEHGKVLVLHAGDFLFPSLLSRRFKGEQMIDLMNRLDGDAEAHDPLMFVTFGNHEFDKDRLKHHRLVSDRIQSSQFDWVSANVEFRHDDHGAPLVQGHNLHPYRLIDVNGTRVGLFGITIDTKHPAYVERFGNYVETSRAMTAKLRGLGAELVIALTHLTMDNDKELLGRLGDDGPDIIFGGHEHHRQTAEIKGRLAIKADADAVSAAVARITPRADKPPLVEHRFQIIPGEVEPDPVVAERTILWEARYQHEYCKEKGLGELCLDKVIGRTQVELVAEELTIRRFATNLGNWAMDLALETFRSQGAQVAFINSGSLRLNRNIAAGSEITRRTLDELFAYPNELVLIRITGARLKQIVARSVEEWSGNGHWLQISGFDFRHHPGRGLVDRLRLHTPDGPRQLADDEQILAVTNRYLIDSQGDQDGYLMLTPDMLVDPGTPRTRLRDLVIAALQAAEPDGIAPLADGRICNGEFIEETCQRPE